MVVEGGLGILFGVVQRARNDRRVRNLDAGQNSSPRAGLRQGLHSLRLLLWGDSQSEGTNCTTN